MRQAARRKRNRRWQVHLIGIAKTRLAKIFAQPFTQPLAQK